MKWLFALAAVLLMAAPAQASTLPDVGLTQNHLAVTAGLFDASVDYGVTDRLQLGVGGNGHLLWVSGYGRLTYRLLDDSPLGDVGLHVAVGTYNPVLAKGAPALFVFAGPAIARSFGSIVTVRASLGVVASSASTAQFSSQGTYQSGTWGLGHHDLPLPILPNLEVGFKLGGHHELTLGGNALIGWRNRF